MRRRVRLLAAIAVLGGVTLSRPAASEDATAHDPLLYTYGTGRIKLSIEANVTGLYSLNTYWGAANIIAPGAAVDFYWAEGFARPGIRIDQRLSDAVALYGGADVVGSFTADEDIVGTKDVTALSMDSLYGGIRFGAATSTTFVDLSGGSQVYVVGTGMLLGDGAPEGSARGAVTIAPFHAWDQAAIARVGVGGFEAQAFYLDADEIYEPDTNTTLAGGNLQYTLRPNEVVGISGGHILNSDATYLRAIPNAPVSVIIPDAREGMNFVNGYGRINPFASELPGFFISGDYAYEWNERIDMKAWGARIAIGNTFAEVVFKPKLWYDFHTMSGDKARTAAYEGFDPLFNSGSDWAVGANSALIFSNSNVQVHHVGLSLTLTAQDLVGLNYYHVRTNELQSPIPVDPSSIPPSGVSSIEGASSKDLANELSADYTRIISKNIFLSTALLYSHPEQLAEDFAGQPLPDWIAGTATILVKY